MRRKLGSVDPVQRGLPRLALLRGVDHGEPIKVRPEDVGAAVTGRDADRWIDAFLGANTDALQRLALHMEIRPGVAPGLVLHPGARVGAVPLRSPITRRVAAGVLVASRFGWPALGAVLNATAFRVAPALGGLPLVPGSAREVPPYIIAGPVLGRLRALVERMTRGFIEATEDRTQPRGRVDWRAYGERALPRGMWQRFRCTFPDLADDPMLLAAVRWTLARLLLDLERVSGEPVVRPLLDGAHALVARVGTGPQVRPSGDVLRSLLEGRERSDWLRAAVEGMGWVAEDRGLGGAASLDGLAWSLDVDALWESWVEAFLDTLGPRLGARVRGGRRSESRWPILWESRIRSMTHLLPDFVLELAGRTVFVDAKYKWHLETLRRRSWAKLSEVEREGHRADIHQILAYAGLAEADRVDAVLVYPLVAAGTSDTEHPFAVADVPTGRRQMRLLLAGLPFGFAGPAPRDATLTAWTTELRRTA